MSDITTTAAPEYCAYCGRRLGAARVIVSGLGEWADKKRFHIECVENWRREQLRSVSDTSNRSETQA